MIVAEINLGGRLIPRSLTEASTSATSLTEAVQYIVDSGAVFGGISMNASRAPTFANSVLPAWRDTLFLAFFGMYVIFSNK